MERLRTDRIGSGINAFSTKHLFLIYTLVRRRGLKTSSNDRANETRASWKMIIAAIGARMLQAACGLKSTPRRCAALIITPQLALEYGTIPRNTRPVCW